MNISAKQLDFRQLNQRVRQAEEDVVITDCYGQRFIGSGLEDKKITICGTPGNALGAYLNGGEIHVHGNAQDAVGDTMNDGKIIIHGNAGDALGYAMRGGCIYVRGNAGYRMGIHMKQYRDKKPVIVVGGGAGSFLGEYLAGGILVVLDLEESGRPVGYFPGTGMHGGKIFLRANTAPKGIAEQITVCEATDEDLQEIAPYLEEFSACFGLDKQRLLSETYFTLRPNAKNPYKQLYVAN